MWPWVCQRSDFMAESLALPNTQDAATASWNSGGLCVPSLKCLLEMSVCGTFWMSTVVLNYITLFNPYLIGDIEGGHSQSWTSRGKQSQSF